LVLSLPVAAALLVWALGRKRPPARVLARHVLLPLVLVSVSIGVATGYYFWRITGSPFVMPYEVNRATYSVARYFLWQPPNLQPVYHNEAMRDFYLKVELPIYQGARSVSTFLCKVVLGMILGNWIFYVGSLLTMGLFALPWALRDQRIRFLVLAGTASFAAMALNVFFQVHYAAPITALIFTIILQGLRHVRAWRWEGRPTGLFLVRSTVLMCVLMIPVEVRVPVFTVYGEVLRGKGQERARLLTQLHSLPGPQLVLVRYGPDHDSKNDWVYNEADIDGAKVVWARDMGAMQNIELINYFKDRHVWLLEPDRDPRKLLPYPVMSCSPRRKPWDPDAKRLSQPQRGDVRPRIKGDLLCPTPTPTS
jgi:hypothetical protein